MITSISTFQYDEVRIGVPKIMCVLTDGNSGDDLITGP
jgi:hypothetical protein